MSSLGIYFGPKVISVVEAKGKRVLNNIQISRLALSTGELEEKVPDDIKIVTIFKDELNKNKIETREAVLALSGKDLIIRTFDMPMLPANELPAAVNFEARKYIPFKVEDLVSDFQLQVDKAYRRNLVLFVGIKKETLAKYISILEQSEIKATSIEYSAFSNLRLLSLTGISYSGILGVISMDFQEEDEINFAVLENGFPLFSRDITLAGGPAEFLRPKETEPGRILEKFKTEIRISLDYYHRKFSAKNIKKIFFISSEDYRSDLEAYIEDIGLSAKFIDIKSCERFIGKSIPFRLSFIKGYSSSLSKVIKTRLRINLLAAKAKIAPVVREAIAIPKEVVLKPLKVEPKIVILGILICISTFLFGLYRILTIKQELNSVKGLRPNIATTNPEASFDEVNYIYSEYNQKIISLDELIKKQLYLTETLNFIPRIIPKGIWLSSFSFGRRDEGSELVLTGYVYLGDNNREFEMLEQFVSDLKGEENFNKYFKEIKITSFDYKQVEEAMMTNFVINCWAPRRTEP